MTSRLPSGGEMEAEVAEVGADDVLNLRQVWRAADPDQRAVCVEVVEERLKLRRQCTPYLDERRCVERIPRGMGNRCGVNWICSRVSCSCSSSSPVWRWPKTA